MFYEPGRRDKAKLPHDPFKAIVAPRPIGWISTRALDGRINLAPYSFFNGFAGRPYDTMFEWSDDRLYCSELVWKLYDRALGIRIGERQKIAEFRLAAPAVHAKLRERYGARIPTDRLVISPQAMAASPLLITVETL